jgi:hypothetical protein
VAEVVVTPVASTKVMESPVAKARVSSSSTPTKNIGAFGLTWAGVATDGSGTNMPATFDDLYGEEGGRRGRLAHDVEAIAPARRRAPPGPSRRDAAPPGEGIGLEERSVDRRRQTDRWTGQGQNAN